MVHTVAVVCRCCIQPEEACTPSGCHQKEHVCVYAVSAIYRLSLEVGKLHAALCVQCLCVFYLCVSSLCPI